MSHPRFSLFDQHMLEVLLGHDAKTILSFMMIYAKTM